MECKERRLIALKIDETKLNFEEFTIERTDKDTVFLYFDELFEADAKFYTNKEFDDLKLLTRDEFMFTHAAEYWIDKNKWIYFLLFDAEVVDWDISNDMRMFVKRKIAYFLCDYNRTGCSDCKFNHATGFNCPLGKG